MGFALSSVGCETAKDVGHAVNPVNWFESSDKKADAKSEAGAKEERRVAKVEDKGTYPKLSSVPEAPKTTSAEERLIIQEGLLADRENARYSEGPPPRLYPQLNERVTPDPLKKSPRTPVEEAALSPKSSAGSPSTGDRASGVRIVTVKFPEGTADVPDDTTRYLSEVVAVQRRYGGVLRVVGHADGTRLDPDPAKDRLANFNLSVGRAKAIANALVSLGVGRDQVLVEAEGENLSLAEAGQRTVEVFLVRANN